MGEQWKKKQVGPQKTHRADEKRERTFSRNIVRFGRGPSTSSNQKSKKKRNGFFTSQEKRGKGGGGEGKKVKPSWRKLQGRLPTQRGSTLWP